MVIDINLDDGLLDGMAAMQKFCKIAVTEPDVSKVRQKEKHGKWVVPGYVLPNRASCLRPHLVPTPTPQPAARDHYGGVHALVHKA